jgi:hypothetical protein
LLILPVLLLWESSQQRDLNILSVAVVIGVIYLIAWSPALFLANLLAWLVAAYLILRSGRSRVLPTAAV